MYVRKEERLLVGNKPMTKKKRWKNKQFFFLLEIGQSIVGHVFELCNTETKIVCCIVNKWTTILKGLTIEVHNIFNRC